MLIIIVTVGPNEHRYNSIHAHERVGYVGLNDSRVYTAGLGFIWFIVCHLFEDVGIFARLKEPVNLHTLNCSDVC